MCHLQILAMREFGLFSARLLMGQLSQLAAMAFKLSGWYKEFTKEVGGEGRPPAASAHPAGGSPGEPSRKVFDRKPEDPRRRQGDHDDGIG